MGGTKVYLYLVAAALVGTATAFLGIPWLVPFVQAGLAYVVLIRDLRRGELAVAVRHMLFWAVCVSIVTIQFTINFHDAAAEGILRGEPYRIEMFRWIQTGEGAEGSPRLFLPEHLRHYFVTLASSAITAGASGILLGSVLLDYMNYYVGSLIFFGDDKTLASLIGWPVWSMVRVVGFVSGAIGMAHLCLAKLLKKGPWQPFAFKRLMLVSVTFFIGDIVLKWLLAPMWREMLRSILP